MSIIGTLDWLYQGNNQEKPFCVIQNCGIGNKAAEILLNVMENGNPNIQNINILKHNFININ